jgi:hypothetical protein
MEISKKTLNASQHSGNLPGGNGAQYSVQLLEKARADTETVLNRLGSQLGSPAKRKPCQRRRKPARRRQTFRIRLNFLECTAHGSWIGALANCMIFMFLSAVLKSTQETLTGFGPGGSRNPQGVGPLLAKREEWHEKLSFKSNAE